MTVPRGKMLGGSSGINYMAYVRGHPGDFDAWVKHGAAGWSYREVLPYFKKSEGLAPSDEIAIDAEAHNTTGPLGVSVRAPVLTGAREFVDAAVAAGIPRGDYNGRDRGGPRGVVSLFQTTTRNGKRSSTYHAFLEGETEQRPNLTIITGAHVDARPPRRSAGPQSRHRRRIPRRRRESRTALAAKEVVLCGGAIGSPQLLLLSGIGPREELAAVGISCQVDSAARRQASEGSPASLADFPRTGGRRLHDRDRPLVRTGRPPRTGRPAPRESPRRRSSCRRSCQALKQEAERRINEWATTGPRPDFLVPLRRGGLVFHGPGRSAHP